MDALDLVPEKTIPCLDLGFVTLVDVMPRIVPDGQTCDYAIAQMARVSYGQGTKSLNEDRGLIRYLLRHSHTSPFEGIELKFHMKMPVFIARQAIRHRTCSLNEISGRYSVMKDEFYYPSANEIRAQSKSNKQGSEGKLQHEDAENFEKIIRQQCRDSYAWYQNMLEADMAREQARMILPLNLYTEWYWKQDLHNLLHFLALRSDTHAQYEIRVYAEAILKLIQPLVPWTLEAWNDYHVMRNAVKLTALECEAIKKHNLRQEQTQGVSWMGFLESDNKREQTEWIEKAKELGFNILDKA